MARTTRATSETESLATRAKKRSDRAAFVLKKANAYEQEYRDAVRDALYERADERA